MSVRVIEGDCLAMLRAMDAETVQCCVTSPPYWGLRDYGTAKWEGGDAACNHVERLGRNDHDTLPTPRGGHGDGARPTPIYYRDVCPKCNARRVDSQLGLERTPDEYVANMVAVFRDVRRVLRDDGVLFLNLGDSYYGSASTGGAGKETAYTGKRTLAAKRGEGLKPKDLCGIPWRVAFALQQPYYAGKIRDERDRIWLAAMLEAEGCLFIHKRKAGQNAGDGYLRQSDTYSPGFEIANTHYAIIERCAEIAGVGSVSTQEEGRRQQIWRWTVRAEECRSLMRELYPHIIAKRQQARIVCGCPTSGEKASAAHEGLKALHSGSTTDVDFAPPSSMFEPGWYLRSEVIWAKPNPMPESVTDRPTKAHEQVFLLAKSERYFYDAEAIAEPVTEGTTNHVRRYAGSLNVTHIDESRNDRNTLDYFGASGTRNRRSVWTVATTPYSGAHFATFPPKLIEPCILAGTSPQACEHCAAPWERVTDGATYYAELSDDEKSQRTRKTNHVGNGHGGAGRGPKNNLGNSIAQTLGWQPTCSCANNTGAGRCVVLDPFGGAGTTGLVADRLGRDAILIELNPEYAAMARNRIAADNPLFTDVA